MKKFFNDLYAKKNLGWIGAGLIFLALISWMNLSSNLTFVLFFGLYYGVYRQTQNLLKQEDHSKELIADGLMKNKQQTAKLKLLNYINSQKNLETDLKEIIEEFFQATRPLSESSHAFMLCSDALENPYSIPFYQAAGFSLHLLNTPKISSEQLYNLIGENLIRKSDPISIEIFHHFIKTEDNFVDWVLKPLPSAEFRSGGMLFLARETGSLYSEIEIEIIENMVSQFSVRTDNSRLFKKVEDANKMKTAFLSNMSHEIRTPLNAIIGFSEMMEKPTTPEKKQVLIEGIQKNTIRLTNIIDNILDISKIEFGRIFLNKKLISLSLFIKNIENIMRSQSLEKDLDFKIESIGLLPSEIKVDENRIKQILINLIGNAIKFTEKGSILLKIEYDRFSSPQPSMLFNVIDSGIGISVQSQLDLFQTFSQIDASSTRRYGGLGLGLALSSRLAQQFGGEVKLIQSQVNHGSDFQLRIPCSNLNTSHWLGFIFEDLGAEGELFHDSAQLDLNSQVHLSSHTQPIDMTRHLSLKNKKILVVEDSQDNQEIFKFFLSAAGAFPEISSDGEDAVK
ncbi:MAG: hypothetical protein H7Z71_00415, partial [Moraxellaceae bacterium]|nr:hypothetical protein [Pseudobdellovibrionaceae bacterium]